MRMTQPREITESFRLDRVLKSSRSGIVFRATELATGRAAAIKLIAPSCPADLHICQEQFLEAMDAWRELGPATFPVLYDFGFTPDGSAFMVMEYIEGTPIEALVGQDASRVLRLLATCVDGLSALASRGISHGNLTPQNVLVHLTPQGEEALVLGFGTAAFRVFMGELTGAVLASDALEFAAPELIDPHAGLARADVRSDMYSLAQVACRVLQARVATTPEQVVSVQLPPAILQVLPGAGSLCELLTRLLSPSPEARPAGWSEVSGGLSRVLAREVAEPPAPATPAGAAEPPAPSGTLFLSLHETPSQPAETAASPAPDAEARPAEPTERTQPIPAATGSEEAALLGATGEGATPAEGEARPQPPGLPPESAKTQALPVAGAEIQPPPVEYGAERTMAVPVHRLTELPGSESAAVAAGDAPLEEHVQVVTPPSTAPAFGPAAAPPPPVFESTAEGVTVPSLYDTDKGRIAVEPVGSPPPSPEGPGPTPPPLPPTLPPVPATELAEPVLEPEMSAPVPTEEAAPATGRQPVARPSAVRGKRSLWPLWLVLAVLLLGGGAVGVMWWQSQQAEQAARRRFVPPTPRPPTPVPTEAPKQPPAVLAEVRALEEALAASDLKAAQQVLDSITTLDEQQLPAPDLEHLQRLRQTYGELRVRTFGSDLSRALQTGNVKTVQRIMGSMTREEQSALAADPDRAQALEEARRVLNVLKLAQNAERAGAWVDLLQQANALREVMPKADVATELREKAARGLEAEAANAAQAGNYPQATDRLAALAKVWPDRPGLQARIERIKTDQDAEQKAAAAIAQAEQSERQQQPERGLGVLQNMRPPSRLEPRVAELKTRLEAQLRQLDAQPPKVELQRGAKLEYEKGKMARIPFVVTDDHGVKSAKMFVRVEGGGKYAEMNLSRGSGNEWAGEITAVFHKNENVQLFVVVTDYSDQVGVLGSSDKPLLLKRKKVLGIF